MGTPACADSASWQKDYESILKKYNLIPEETLFIDDTQANVEAAQKMGIKIIHLREKNKLKEELLKKEIEL